MKVKYLILPVVLLFVIPIFALSADSPPADSYTEIGYVTREVGTGLDEKANGTDIRTYVFIAEVLDKYSLLSNYPVTLVDAKWCDYYVKVTYVGTGPRNFEFYFDFTNPSSNKWRHYMSPKHSEFGDTSAFNYNTFTAHYVYKNNMPDLVVNRLQTVTSGMRLWGFVDITKVPTYIEYHFIGHALITDLNGDRVVNIIDVSMVAQKMWTKYNSIQDPLTKYDMDMSLDIGIFDITQVALDFGYQVPP